MPTGKGGSGGERKIIETRRPAKHNGVIEAVAWLDLEIDGGEIMQKRGI